MPLHLFIQPASKRPGSAGSNALVLAVIEARSSSTPGWKTISREVTTSAQPSRALSSSQVSPIDGSA